MPLPRLIPCLDVAGSRVVKGVRFENLRDVGDPVELGAAYSDAGADELVFLDVKATLDARPALLELVGRVAERLAIPFTVGGGVRSTADGASLLRAGADKVSVNTAALLSSRTCSALRRLSSRSMQPRGKQGPTPEPSRPEEAPSTGRAKRRSAEQARSC